MCGINGFTFSDPELLRKMHRITHHRGPDDEGFFESDGISFAHNRLSIIDLSEGGRQPMSTPDGRYTIVYNGEIYNYRELRAELESLGETFRTESDTEVLLLAYAKWGRKSLSKLNGIFAFAIWDERDKRLDLVRDPIGVKPLYYHWDGKRLIFSSEIKAILEHGIPREIDRDALSIYFRLLYVPGPRTLFKRIEKLMPGSIGSYRQGEFRIEQWWELKEGERISSYQEAVEGIRERALASVRRELVSDRPLGVFLSGGIDSSSVLGMMENIGVKDIKTFTMGYETDIDPEKYNADAKLAERTAKHFNTDHHSFTLSAQDVMDTMEQIIWHMDEPVANHIQPSTFLIAKYSKPTITVALGGDGGDELFGGYSRYWYASLLDRLRFLRPFVANKAGIRDSGFGILDSDCIPNTEIRNPNSERGRLRAICEKLAAKQGLERHVSFIAQKEAMVGRFLQKGWNDTQAVQKALQPHFSAKWGDRVNQLMAVDISTWIPDESLVRTDKLTMASALEERVPLLDVDLVEYASRIPSKFKLGDRFHGKRVFIDAMRPYLPSHLLHEEKRAWMSPAAKWIRGPLLPWIREILSPSYCEGTKDLFDFEEIEKIVARHVSKEEYALNTIWSLVTFQIWARWGITRN
jgi:asparagine synthase (glutamine-hydrolysing)